MDREGEVEEVGHKVGVVAQEGVWAEVDLVEGVGEVTWGNTVVVCLNTDSIVTYYLLVLSYDRLMDNFFNMMANTLASHMRQLWQFLEEILYRRKS